MKNILISETGVFSGRAFGIFFNMFVLQYILELYQNMSLSIIFIVCSVTMLFLLRKDIKNFFTQNGWKNSYYEIYIAFNLLFSGIASIIGFYYKDFLLVNVSRVEISAKIILMLIYGIIILISVVPNSFIMKVATINEK